jgi:hypothetical protein
MPRAATIAQADIDRAVKALVKAGLTPRITFTYEGDVVVAAETEEINHKPKLALASNRRAAL